MKSPHSFANPIVSVVVRTRDSASSLPNALASVIAQDFCELEILVVDEGLGQGMRDWLQALTAKEPRLRLFGPEGAEWAAARNDGIGRARGEWVAFLDAGDIWAPGKLRTQLAWHLRHPECVMSFADYRRIAADGAESGGSFERWPYFRRLSKGGEGGFRALSNPAAHLLAENVVCASTVMAKRNALQNANGFDAELRSAQDWDLWLRLALAGPVAFSDRPDVYSSVRGGGAGKTESHLEMMRRVIERYAPLVQSLDPGAVRVAFARLALGQAERWRFLGDYPRALREHWEALSLMPSWRVAGAALIDGVRCCLLGLGREARARF